MKARFYTLFIFLTLFYSCTEDYDISNIKGVEDKIVIQGSIENGAPAEVLVTRSNSVTKALDYTNIFIVEGAKVYVSDGIVEDTLINYVDSLSSVPIAYFRGSKIIGSVGGSYSLRVEVDGKTYTAQTTIPALVALDSVWWQADPPEDTLGYAWARLSDPTGYGNAYRWYAKLGRDFRYIAPFGASFDDKFTDGKSFDLYALRGVDPTSTLDEDTDGGFDKYYYKNTDTIYIKFCTIDYASFRFYYSYETALQSNGNPFASPVSVQSNIEGGGLGIWSGFGVTYDTIYPTP